MKKIIFLIFITASFAASSQIISPSDGNKFFYNGLADVSFQYAPRGSGGRAFVHDNYNVLSLNYGEDFTGGTRIGRDVYFKDGDKSFIYSGNFGIGTTNPTSKLTIQASPDGYPTPLKAISILGPNSPENSNSARDLSWDFAAAGSAVIRSFRGANWDTYLQFMTNHSLGGDAPQVRMHINDNGNIGIGTTTPDSKLTVAGNIHAQEVKVTINAGLVPDYVFANDYKLKSLQEVEDYIKQNSHLPEIQSAREIEKNGLMLAKMNLDLLKKIEEMTLYMIEQNKQIINLKNRLEKVENNF
ncbi:hypothetical protein [Flavobacterium sp. C3NV]|uniref:hypothetical protein n=1 Tax=Flavobacterium sp. C3NV TaxID=3393358 RepID=UPI0039903555